MKWMIYFLIAAAVTAHYVVYYLDHAQTVEMAKTHPVFVRPLEEK